ncbi:KleE stable inheritance protein [Janthinobacterium sp. J1-1]|uniref:KleE stable inheritance protein n=1 Tax=Janthinobacterium sp. J1-1 TaxID=3065910 RepID=UPI002812852F|nr:KleE stable inheritance protein [Janthinobacterium sp. J1-1]
MADIIQFPSDPGKEKSSKSPLVTVGPPARPCLRKILWVVAVLCWPALRLIMACDVLLQLMRTLVLWDTPGAHAGWALLLHFAFFCYLTWFVAYGDPDAPR